MGAFRFKTSGVKTSRLGMDKMGSKPSSEIGGSFKGSAQSLMRPRRRASKNASSSISASSSFGSARWSMNWVGVSAARGNVAGLHLHVPRRPCPVWLLRRFLVIHRRLTLELTSPTRQMERR